MSRAGLRVVMIDLGPGMRRVAVYRVAVWLCESSA